MLNRKQRKEALMELPKDTIISMFLQLEEDCDKLTQEITDELIEFESQEKQCDEECQCKKDKLCKEEYL